MQFAFIHLFLTISWKVAGIVERISGNRGEKRQNKLKN